MNKILIYLFISIQMNFWSPDYEQGGKRIIDVCEEWSAAHLHALIVYVECTRRVHGSRFRDFLMPLRCKRVDELQYPRIIFAPLIPSFVASDSIIFEKLFTNFTLVSRFPSEFFVSWLIFFSSFCLLLPRWKKTEEEGSCGKKIGCFHLAAG